MVMQRKLVEKQVIGRHAKVVFLDSGSAGVNAKVDTGADSSSVWASHLAMDDNGTLRFILFDKRSPYYTGKEIAKKQYTVKVVRSSNGHEQIRYSVKLRVSIDGRRFLATFTLADRSRNIFPVLIGSRLLKNKFLVDVSQGIVENTRKKKSADLTQLAKKNPKEFFNQQYASQATHNEKE